MKIANFYYKIYIIDNSQKPISFCGNAFPIIPNGGLITCRHVIDTLYEPETFKIVVYDNELNRFTKINRIIFPTDNNLDIVLLPNALDRKKEEYIPILEPSKLKIGEDVYSFGYYSIGDSIGNEIPGYFSGKIVNMFNNQMKGGYLSLTLPYSVLEGMSGSPVMTYYNGPKLVGICYGNQALRIIASEVVEYKDTKKEYKESISRITEFGLAYHPSILISFLREKSVNGFIVSEKRLQIKGLEE